ncbi:MAG: HAMP domain-containing protein [Pirellulales bacterium]|nr:HAMP domain-containing protein [Pirellulales bacterium]
MSYRTIKRVLGETNLERKCRWWFGISLVVLLTLSFTWYGRRTDTIVKELNPKFIGPELVRAGWLGVHFAQLDQIKDGLFADLVESSQAMGRRFEWEAILPTDGYESPPAEQFRPRDAREQRLLAKWSIPLTPDEKREAGNVQGSPSTSQPFLIPSRGTDDRYVKETDGRDSFMFYQPMYATKSCIRCHANMLDAGGKRKLEEGDLIAVVRVTTDYGPTAAEVAKNQALLWTAAIVVGFVSMFSLWAVVRYVIVKPVTHLRDVANAVREGDIEKRAVIRTGDEFEELGAAFNRMLRQLLSQQSELQESKSELDVRLDELAQANMRLYEMNRLKSDFLATVSHELRTPLNSILGFSEVLSSIDSLDDKQRRYVGNIQRSGRMLLDMINDILDLAKMESGKMEVRQTEFRISSLISTMCEMARPLAEKKNIDLDCEAPTNLPPLRQDQAKVQQVLNNLLSNAIKFTPEGGRIRVSAEQDEHGDLRLKVADTGIGISPDEQQLVFEKFRQASGVLPDGDAMTREYSGTGLGLSIVREICRLLGGDVTLESELGKGSTFSVRLPWRLEDSPRLDTQLREDLDQLARNARLAEVTSSTAPHLQEQTTR